MPRSAPPPVPTTLSEPQKTSLVLKLQTITPMFGGSATTREVDPQFPVRAASVRGHLRFWWRATAGAKCSSSRELFAAEEKLWGSASKWGAVSLTVHDQEAAEPRVPSLPQALGYATFPFQEQRGGNYAPAAEALKEVAFTLTVSAPTLTEQELDEVKVALRAWVNFGGIGARTRRGCGSLRLEDDSVLPQLGGLTRQATGLLTTLPGRYYVVEGFEKPVQAWAEAVGVYRDFRQAEDFARNPGRQRNRPGRSRYPEPDTLRRITRRHAEEHHPTHPVNGFPRADLGLPIIFQFKDKRDGDPDTQTLQGKEKGRQRFASPIITKAAWLNDKYCAVILVLDAPHVWEGSGVELKGQRDLISRAQIDLSPAELQQVSPLAGFPIREALVNYATQERNFREVSL